MTEKYLLKIKTNSGDITEYTIPKNNIKALAIVKAMDTGYNKPITTDLDAIEFLNSLDIEVI